MDGVTANSVAALHESLPQRAPSVVRMWRDRVAATPEREAYRFPQGTGWASLTWGQAGERVERMAAGLLSLGVRRGDRVGIVSTTRVEWILVDTAIMSAGGVTTTVYPSTPAPDVAFILADAQTRVVVVEDVEQLGKIKAHRGELPGVEKVVLVDGDVPPGDGDWVMRLDELAELGAGVLAAEPAVVEKAAAELGPEDLATLIYTSGTTGRPKGVQLVHDCWTYTAAAVEGLEILSADDVQYLWLPLAHAFGKVLTSAHIGIGFVTAVDGSIPRLVDNLAVVKPTFMAAAPRIFEKVHNRVVCQVKEEGGVKLRIFQWAMGVGRRASAVRQGGGEPGGLLRLENALADRLVFAKVRDRFGGRIRFFVSGSAALSKEIAEFFHAMDVLVLEGYGLTETSASGFVNRPTAYRFGTVGPAFPGTEVRIADDGEILVRGPEVMRGYQNLPQESAETLTEDGWLHTGDIGELEDGFLRITDRKKDLIKTSGGKYVAPQALEIQFKAICPYASQIVVHGDGRNFCSALITVDEEEIRPWLEQHGLTGLSYAEVTQHPAVQELMAGYVDELNAGLARWETVKKFALLPRDLDVEHGELTPSLKVKRRVVEDEYRELLDGLYAGSVASV
ncbi:MAG: AMP-dependent synthetase/ligase [Motilibacteraceae bacterium]